MQLHFPIRTIFIFNASNHPTRISRSNGVTGDVLCHDRTRTDHNIVTNRNSWIDHNISTDPHIISDVNRLCVFQSGGTHRSINRMSCRVNAYMRTEKNTVSKGYIVLIQNQQSCVGIEMISKCNFATMIAVERRCQHDILSDCGKYLFQFPQCIIIFPEF